MTDLDPMDTRLRAYAERWRASVAPPPPMDPEQLGRKRGVPTWSVILGSAAAIAVLILGATQLVDHDEPAGPATPSATAPDHPVETPPLTRDDALRRALASDPAVRAEVLGGLAPKGPVLCGIHVLGSSAKGNTLYLWLSCSDYAVADGAATAGTGSHEPAVVQVRGSGADIAVEKVTFPRQQSLDADIKRLFPPSIAAHIYDEASTRTSPSTKELEAEALASTG